jgi:hypothetical protein
MVSGGCSPRLRLGEHPPLTIRHSVCSLDRSQYSYNSGFLLHADEVATCNVSMSSFVYRTTRLWNALPKSAYGMSLGAFKRFVKSIWI